TSNVLAIKTANTGRPKRPARTLTAGSPIFSISPHSRIDIVGFQEAFFRGTFLPFFRASESPIAMACLRLFTLPPLPPFPLRSVPFFLRRSALSTRLLAALPYLRPPDRFLLVFFFAAMERSSVESTPGALSRRV